MGKILFVGQAPSKLGEKPFVGRSGMTVARLLGIEYVTMFDAHAFVNVVDDWQGKSGKGDKFAPNGDDAIGKITVSSKSVDGIVLCGKAVAKALGVKKQPYLDLFRLCDKPAMVLPHPSGINMWWNDKVRKLSAQRRLRSFVSKS